jgi:aromatic ring-opening dioxygenase catalytic subunit (LigB family)
MILPTYFLSHGGGPWPYMEGPFRRQYDQLEAGLKAIRADMEGLVRAVLVISGHWEERDLAISSGVQPGMEYDYYGFPDYLYRIHYRAPGSPALAARVQALLAAGGAPARLDPHRGYDHGTFSMLQPIYPEALMPVVQLSLHASLDPALHLAIGRLLAPLRAEGVLIIGSGLSYHNLRVMDPRARDPSARFDGWLQDTLVDHTGAERSARLEHWSEAPAARLAHPREDHLIPLMVAVGAAENDGGTCVYHQADLLGNLTASSFRFGPCPGTGPAAQI